MFADGSSADLETFKRNWLSKPSSIILQLGYKLKTWAVPFTKEWKSETHWVILHLQIYKEFASNWAEFSFYISKYKPHRKTI